MRRTVFDSLLTHELSFASLVPEPSQTGLLTDQIVAEADPQSQLADALAHWRVMRDVLPGPIWTQI